VLPTFLATSELGVFNLVLTIVGFTAVYGVLAVVECSLMLHAIKRGPDAVTGETISFADFPTITGAGAVAPAE
jgi:cytochrome bd ubiquinol oxidase subunit I